MNQAEPVKVRIMGIGDDGWEGLAPAGKKVLEEADVIVGTQRALGLLPSLHAETVSIGTDLAEVVRRIERGPRERIVVLAAGDPLFHGVARFLFDRLGKDRFEVLPHVSTMQLAFARVKESWEDAYLVDVAQQPIDVLVDRIRSAETVGIFTNDRMTPRLIAKALLDADIDYFRVYICENLGARNEVVTQGTLDETARSDFGPLNVMILVRKPNTPDAVRKGDRRLFGNSDEVFRQSRPKRGLLTPAEVRVLALAQLNVRPDSIVWDVGAGSGSVSIESAQLATAGRVFAIEPDIEDCALIRANADAFGVGNVEVVTGRAPEAFESLPDPDCVFIGGAGRETVGILREAFRRLCPAGRLVVNVASIENVSHATATLKGLVSPVGVLMINLARGVHQLETTRFEASNPTFLVFVTKPSE